MAWVLIGAALNTDGEEAAVCHVVRVLCTKGGSSVVCLGRGVWKLTAREGESREGWTDEMSKGQEQLRKSEAGSAPLPSSLRLPGSWILIASHRDQL